MALAFLNQKVLSIVDMGKFIPNYKVDVILINANNTSIGFVGRKFWNYEADNEVLSFIRADLRR